MNKCTTILVSLVLLSTASFASAKELTLQETMEATCQVTAIGHKGMMGQQEYAIGSGTVIKEDEDSYYILTNAHVVRETGGPVKITFFMDGLKTIAFDANVSWRFFVPKRSIDLAIVTINKKQLSNFRPRVIPLAPNSYHVQPGTYIQGAGVPRGGWMQAWEARILGDDGTVINFNMMPEPGQSGSGILGTVDIDGEKHTMVVGLLTWRIIDQPRHLRMGGGLSLQQLHRILTYNPKSD